MIIKGTPVLWGVDPRIKLKIENLPPDCRVRVRARNNRVAMAFLRFKDRTESWSLGPGQEDGIRLVCKTGENISKQ